MNRNYWIAATDELVGGYHGMLTSELVPGARGTVLRHHADEHTVDIAWLDSKGLDEIEHRVPVSTLVFDVQVTGAADHVARKVASKVSGKHGIMNGPMHEMKSVGPAHVVCLPHRHGGTAVRVDFVCEGCGGPPSYSGAAWAHEESLLPYVDGRYVGGEAIGKLRMNDSARLEDGSRRCDRRGLALLARVLFDATPRSVTEPNSTVRST